MMQCQLPYLVSFTVSYSHQVDNEFHYFCFFCLTFSTFKGKSSLFGNLTAHLVSEGKCMFMYLIWFSEWTSIVSLDIIILLIFIMEMECVFCEPQTEFTHLIHGDLRFKCVNALQMNVSAPSNSNLQIRTYQVTECIA
jgi:hypothetical protein